MAMASNSDIERNADGSMQQTMPGVPAADPFASFDDYHVVPRQAASGQGNGITNFGTPDVYADAGNRQIASVSQGTPAVLFGNHEVYGQGLYVAYPGYDVRSDPDKTHYLLIASPTVQKFDNV